MQSFLHIRTKYLNSLFLLSRLPPPHICTQGDEGPVGSPGLPGLEGPTGFPVSYSCNLSHLCNTADCVCAPLNRALRVRREREEKRGWLDQEEPWFVPALHNLPIHNLKHSSSLFPLSSNTPSHWPPSSHTRKGFAWSKRQRRSLRKPGMARDPGE